MMTSSQKWEFFELTYVQFFKGDDIEISGGMLYGDDFSTGKSATTGHLNAEEAYKKHCDYMTKMGSLGWELVSVTKFPRIVRGKNAVVQSFYFNRPAE